MSGEENIDEGSRNDFSGPASSAFAGDRLRAFASVFGNDAGNLLVSAAPDWFDDMWGKDTLSIAVDRDGVVSYVEAVNWNMDSRRDPEHAEIRRVLAESVTRQEFGPELAAIVQRLADFALDGEGRREAVTQGFPGIGPDDAIHFLRVSQGGSTRTLMAIGETNGFTDVAYELAEDGSVVFWPEAELAEVLKDGGFPRRLPGDPPEPENTESEDNSDPYGFTSRL